MADQAAADSPTSAKQILAGSHGGSMYTVNTAPERRSVTKISGEPGNYKIEVVSDYQAIEKITDEIRTYSAREAGVKTVGSPDEFADLDDEPYLQQMLISAWVQLAQYYSACDDEDKKEALDAMNAVSAMIADDESDDAAGNSFTCQYCQRDFASQDAAIKHLASVHSAREHETKMKTERD